MATELDRPTGEPGCSVELMNADGSGLTDLTGTRNGCDGAPSFTPDGSRIVFEHFDLITGADAIWSMNTSGADRHLITTGTGSGVTAPEVSPDGTTLTFVDFNGQDFGQALFTAGIDGTGLRQLTPFTLDVGIKLSWAPDGSHITLTPHANFDGHFSPNVATINPDGSDLRYLTHYNAGGAAGFTGSYSPDGQWIVFRHQTKSTSTFGLFKIRPDGTRRALIAELPFAPLHRLGHPPVTRYRGPAKGSASTLNWPAQRLTRRLRTGPRNGAHKLPNIVDHQADRGTPADRLTQGRGRSFPVPLPAQSRSYDHHSSTPEQAAEQVSARARLVLAGAGAAAPKPLPVAVPPATNHTHSTSHEPHPRREQTMTIHEYLSKAVQNDAQRPGERDRLLLEARRAGAARRPRAGPAMRRLVALVTVAGMIVLGLVAAGGPAGAVVSGANGRIVFARCIAAPAKCFGSSSAAVWEIVAADPNDTNETVLAGPYPRDAWDDHFIANWSPDGKTVIFMANQGIWQVNADGSDLHLVWSPPPDGTGLDDGPTFTPDGKYIIFTRCCPQNSGYALWRINADGTGLRKVTTEIVPPGVDGPSDNLPQVSPDGTLIAFHRNVVTCGDPSDCGNRIVTVNINGGNRIQLTDPALEAQIPNWSPDGKKIVFEMFPQVNGQFTANIATINADGSGFTQLTFNAPGKGASIDPSWSPDGTKIIFRHCPSTGFCDLFTMNPDGSDVAQITKTAAGEFWPQWAVASG